MKRLTLNEIWEQCLKMWRWIVRQKCPRNVKNLKEEWLKRNGFKDDYPDSDCFFCEWDFSKGVDSCSYCPAKKVDENFYCGTAEYNYFRKSAAFLRKIIELNKIRLAKLAKRRK